MRVITVLTLGLAVLAAGCGPSVSTPSYPLPPELSDCKLYKLSDGLDSITVARCPNSTTSTTYREGKSDHTAVVVDGESTPVNPPFPTRDALPSRQDVPN
nr:hypothetical protein [Paraburkholderia aspalathi]